MNARLSRTQQRYKLEYDCRVRVTPTFRPSGLVFIDRPPKSEIKSGIADSIANATYSKLMPQNRGQFCIIAVNSHYLVIDENRVRDAVLIARALYAPHSTTSNTNE